MNDDEAWPNFFTEVAKIAGSGLSLAVSGMIHCHNIGSPAVIKGKDGIMRYAQRGDPERPPLSGGRKWPYCSPYYRDPIEGGQ